jgi:hypothetical protein
MLDQQPDRPRKLTPEQARNEQRLYWSRRSPAERLAAATALTQRSYSLLGIDLDERKADLTPRRVSRRKR